MKRFGWTALALSLFAAQAHAHVIPARSVFARFAASQALDKAGSAPLTGRAVVDDGNQVQRVRAQVEVKFPGECNITLEMERPVSVSMAKGRVGGSGPSVPALDALAALGCPLSTLKTVPARTAETSVANIAKAIGVDTRVVSMQQLQGRTAWVVGARPLDVSSPQIWFDKQTNRPLRVIGRHADATWDVRYSGVRSVATARKQPRVTEVWQGNQRRLSIHLMTALDEAIEDEPSEQAVDTSDD